MRHCVGAYTGSTEAHARSDCAQPLPVGSSRNVHRDVHYVPARAHSARRDRRQANGPARVGTARYRTRHCILPPIRGLSPLCMLFM